MVGTDKNLRLAGRLLRVIERHANAHPSLGWIKESAEKNARDFINAAAVYSTCSIPGSIRSRSRRRRRSPDPRKVN